MKKIFLIFALPLFCFLFALNLNLKTDAMSCTINNVEYELPATIGIKTSHSIAVYDDTPLDPVLPTSFSSGITLISIENQQTCLSIKNYPYSITTSYNSKLKKTTYTYHNIILDTINNNKWSYSGNWPNFEVADTYTTSFNPDEPITITVDYYANVGHLTTLEEIQSYILASDDVEGLVLAQIEPTSDAYSPSYNILGEFLVSYRAKDSASNIADINVWVHVVDIIDPIIEGPTSINSNMSNPLTTEQILSLFTISDNFDQNPSISVLSNDFSGNEQKSGVFSLTLEAKDSSSNKTTHTIDITTVDDVPPTITGITHIIKGSNSSMDVNYVKSLLSATDNLDTDLSKNIILQQDNYTESSHIVGNYQLTFIVTDSNGNSSDPYVISIEVYDSIPPIFHVDENVIITDPTRIITKEEIYQLFLKTNQLTQNQIENLSLVEDNYTSNASLKGTYRISYSLNENGETTIYSVDIKVTPKETPKKTTKPLILLSSLGILSLVFIIKRLYKPLLKA